MKRVLLDQGLPRSAAALLTAAGWDVMHVADIGMSRAGDSEILRRALAEARVCVRGGFTIRPDLLCCLPARRRRSHLLTRPSTVAPPIENPDRKAVFRVI